ncbi:10-epi-junenol synthase [Artemisia annua]|uniref:10-epi-junenol synthase n=1 Tax=Artemisia annua TaxID=35608 RepID=A0A2U1NE10_ARTAN|nr:10-epi-junenol synthase [Artemisia annua]
MKDYDKADLYTISTNFQVFRQHGYKLSCDVFNKFKDSRSCKFHDYTLTDVRGLLSFYESTQLRIRGESILDEAMEFTKAQLTGVVDTLQGNLAKQVKHALVSPFHRGMKMVEARLYFSIYEEELSTYDSLITKLANAHFNYLRLLQRQELQILTKWGKDMEFQVITPYARNRIPDLYLWGLGLNYEPSYSQARIVSSKILQLVCVLDDTYDAFATIEELRLLTDAINRWEISAMEQLPEYFKPLYKILLNEHTELEKKLSENGRGNSVIASKQAFQELAGGYLKEAKWRHGGQVPSFQEYVKNGIITSTYNVLFKSCVMGMSEIVIQEALDWYESHPKVLEATGLLGRLYNDITSFKFEAKRAQKQVTSVDAYMNTFGVPEIVAVDELKKMLQDLWKDINEGCLKPEEVSVEILSAVVNLARMTDVVYRYTDRFTFPEKTIEEYITLLIIDPIPM